MSDNFLEIRKYPDKTLRSPSLAVEKIGEGEAGLFEDMLRTMRHFEGIGLAAPQVGISKRLIVADIGRGTLKIANPEVIEVRGKDRMEEGCLSAPGLLVSIERPQEIVVKGLNEKGKPVQIKARGLLARVLLHEIDHLNGRLIVDYLNIFRKIQLKLSRR